MSWWWTGLGLAIAGEGGGSISFEEVSAAAGIARTEQTFGAAWGDVDGDGRPDLWVCHHDSKLPVLWRNRGDGTFADETKERFGELALVDFHASAWGDFDGDGDQDLVTLVGAEHGKGAGAKKLFVNEGGKLTDRAVELGLDDPLSRGRTPAWLDWNRDGLLDVIFTCRTRDDGKAPTTLFVQRGAVGEGERREPEGESARGESARGESARGESASDEKRGAEKRATKGQGTKGQGTKSQGTKGRGTRGGGTAGGGTAGGGTAGGGTAGGGTSGGGTADGLAASGNGRGDDAEVSTAAPEAAARFERALALAEDAVMGNRAHAQLCDLELDGTTELLLVFLDGTRLVRRDEAGAPRVTKLPGAMDAAVVDLDGDGRAEVIPVGAMRHGGLVALQIDGDGVSRRALLPPSRSTITSIAAGDFDNDGDLDLFLVSALPNENDADLLLANDGGELVAVPKAGGAAGTTKGLGDSVAVADYDGDGFLDLFVTNGRGNESDPGPCQLFRNRGRAGGNTNHWLELDFEGTKSNRDGLGAIVALEAGGRTQHRVMTGGMHAFTQDHARLHFGLGAAELVTKLTIRWPSGTVQTLTDVKVDQLLRVREDGAIPNPPG